MASNVKSVASDAQGLRCPICLEVYTAPKNLPCLHTYCQHCLHKYIVKNVAKWGKSAAFNCPECRKETFPPLPDIPVDEWAEHYPYNTLLLSVLPPMKRKVDKNCDSCLYEGTSVRATSYCTVCKETLCLTCEKVHRKNKATRDHSVVNIQYLITDLELAVSLSVSVTCSKHVGKEFEFYGKSHSSMCCSKCFYKSHRSCTEVLQIRDHSERLLKEKEANTRTVMDRLKQLKSHLDQFQNENEGSMKKIEAQVKNIPDEIEVLRKKMNTLLDSIKSKITMEKNALLKEESMVRHEENQQCESISSATANSLHLLETVLAHGNSLHVLTTLQKIEEQLLYYESSVNEKYISVRLVDAKLCLDDRLLSLVKSSDTTIAKIDIVEKKHSLRRSVLPLTMEKTVNTIIHDPSEAKKKTVEGRKPPQKYLNSKPLKDCKPEIIEQLNADYLDGKTPSYSGITCLPDDRIVMVDYCNNKCGLYDSSHQHLADYKLTSRPLCACVVEESQVAVTLHDENKIQLLTVDRSIQPGRIINMSLRCHGIATLSRHQLVVNGDKNGIIYWCIVSMDGSEKSTVKVCPSLWCSGLAVNKCRTRIYISCYQDSAAVYAYSVDGIIIFKYQHRALDGAYGLTVDREDNLYVVGQKSHNIHQVSPDGTHLQVFSTGIPERPLAICFSSSGDEFLLTAESERKLVRKFKLK